MTNQHTPGMPVEVTIKRIKGNLVKYERDNEGCREKLDEPYYNSRAHAKFRLPSGKAKTEVFTYDSKDEDILKAIQRQYSNFKFILANTQNIRSW